MGGRDRWRAGEKLGNGVDGWGWGVVLLVNLSMGWGWRGAADRRLNEERQVINGILQDVLDYVESPQTDYALLVTGPWGCGKTYFWKNVAACRLRSLQRPRRVLYASLYGVSDVREIDRSLFAQSYPGVSRTSVGRSYRLIASALEALGFADLAKIDLRSLVKTNNAVICFDDLERSRLSMKVALGYINTFVEHEGAKAVILTNEAEIADEEDANTYKAMKEKVVGVSLNFQEPDIDTVFHTLVDDYKSRAAFHGFILQNGGLVRQLFGKSETRNIRSLRRALSCLWTCFDAIQSGDVDASEIARQLVYAVAPAAFELYGRGADPAIIRKILGMQFIASAGVSISRPGREESNEAKREEEFAKRYIPETGWLDFVGCPPICEFLVTGRLNKPRLLDWARELIKPLDEKEERNRKLANNFRAMEDGEFAQTASQVLQELEGGEIADLGSYIGLYDRFEFFAEQRLIGMTRQDVFDKCVAGLTKAEEAGRLESKPRIGLMVDHPAFAPRTGEGREIHGRIIEVNDRLIELTESKRIGDLASCLHSDPSQFIDALVDSGPVGLLHRPVFQELDADEVRAWILALPNGLKSTFGYALLERYVNRTPRAEFADELPVLIEIGDVLRRNCEASLKDGVPMPMSLMVTQEIGGVLRQAIERLQQIEKNEGGAK